MGAPGDRYRMAIVDLYGAKARIESIIKGYDEHDLVPSIELMSAVIKDVMDAMQKTHRDRLSDPRYKWTPQCQIEDCWDNGTEHVCKEHLGVAIKAGSCEHCPPGYFGVMHHVACTRDQK